MCVSRCAGPGVRSRCSPIEPGGFASDHSRGVLRRRVIQMDALRVAIVSITSITVAVFPAAGAANAEPPPTQAITTVAIGPGGQPINGYREAPAQGNVVAVNDCSTPS